MVDDQGCLRLIDERNKANYSYLVWPPDFGMNFEGGKVRILNGEGRVVAREGKEILVGGGGAAFSGVERQSLPDECRQGPYWQASPEVSVVR